MNEEQKTGALIFTVAFTLMAVTLVLSQGWGNPRVDLFLHFQYGDGAMEEVSIYTRYVLAPLVIVAGYGAVRYFSLVPPIFRRQSRPTGKKE